jgi:hypothetical protein
VPDLSQLINGLALDMVAGCPVDGFGRIGQLYKVSPCLRTLIHCLIIDAFLLQLRFRSCVGSRTTRHYSPDRQLLHRSAL